MTLDDLIGFTREENKRLIRKYDIKDQRVRTLAQMAKLTEETGELSEAVLASLGLVRKEKLGKGQKNMVAEEVVDVIITAFILAQTLNLDVEKALREKMVKIEQRHNT